MNNVEQNIEAELPYSAGATNSLTNVQPINAISRSKRRPGESETRAWISVLLPLVIHLFLLIATTVFVLAYVDRKHFNLDSRRPPFRQANGDLAVSGFAPLQSDITTLLTLFMVLLRGSVAAWSAATAWRCVFLMMEKSGLGVHEIAHTLIYNLPARFTSHHAGGEGRGTVLLVAFVLIAIVPSQITSPLLAGSITWAPSYASVPGTPVKNIALGVNGQPWTSWTKNANIRRDTVYKALESATSAWDNTNQTTTMKRNLFATRNLGINSTLKNVTVPYFLVSELEWVEDPLNTLTSKQLHSVDDKSGYFNVSSEENPLQRLAPTIALIPDGPWHPPPAFPPPSSVSETRFLVALWNHQGLESCSPSKSSFYPHLPVNISFYRILFPAAKASNCYAFLRVTYEAGVAVCRNCRLSRPTVVENDTALELIPDPMTKESLAMMPEVTTALALTQLSLPPTHNMLEYFSETLSRSYGVAWTTLTRTASSKRPGLQTEVTVSIPATRAQVTRWRVFVWLALNLFVEFSGIVFVIAQAQSRDPVVVQGTLAALLLDLDISDKHACKIRNFSMLTSEDARLGVLRLIHDEDHRKVTISRLPMPQRSGWREYLPRITRRRGALT